MTQLRVKLEIFGKVHLLRIGNPNEIGHADGGWCFIEVVGTIVEEQFCHFSICSHVSVH